MYLKITPNHWYIDIEADSLTPTRIWVVCIQNVLSGERHQFDGGDRFVDWFKAHPEAILVGHNILSYDVPAMTRLLGLRCPLERIVDTLVLSYLYHPQMPGGHSLEAYGIRLKYPKGDFHEFDHFSPEMVAYCWTDVALGCRVYRALVAKMSRVGFSERSCALEHKVRIIIDKQQANGWFFDIPGAERLYATLRDMERRQGDYIRQLFGSELHLQSTYKVRTKKDGSPYSSYLRHLEEFDRVILRGDEYDVYKYRDFNIGSPKQRVERLLSLGWKPEKFTPKGFPKTDEESINDYVKLLKGETAKQVAAIADWLVFNGRANMVNTWLTNVDRTDSRMHGTVMSCAAASRRMTHSGPNTANIPSNEARYGEDCRSLWTVHDSVSRRVVGYDAKSVQMRCFANVLPDVNAGRRYWDTDYCPDPHQENANIVGGVATRRNIKNGFYAFIFGAKDPKLGVTVGGGDPSWGRHVRDKLYELSPGLEDAVRQAQSEFDKRDGFLSCIDGGFVRCPKRSAVLNYKIQPLEAVLMKQADIFIDERASHLDQMKIGDIHDEGQHESAVDCAEELGHIQVQAIRDAGEELGFRVPMDGNYKIGLSWAETH